MATAPLKSRLTLGSWLGVGGFVALVASLMLSIGAPETARFFVYITGLVVLAGAFVLMSAGLSWYRKLKARELRGESDEPGDA